MRVRVACLVVALAAASGHAHIVPVPPSMCAFDPISLDAPTAGITATVAPAGATDQFQITYDPQASEATFVTKVPARAFTAGGVAGSVALPPFFVADMRNSGDLTATPSLAFTMNGGAFAVPTSLTTGLSAAGGVVVEGVPLDRNGRFVLAGISAASGLPPPLDGPLVVRLAGTTTPRPDTDQFRVATQTTPLSAVLTARSLRFKAIFAPGALDTPDFPGTPALLRAATADTMVIEASLPSGLPARGRKLFIGRTPDGVTAIGVRALRRSGQLVYLLAVKVKQPTLPATTASTVPLNVTFDLGGLLSRATLTMRVKKHGALLRSP